LLSAQQSVQHYYGAQATRYYKGASQVFVNEKRNSISFVRLNPNENVPAENSVQWLRQDILRLRPEDGLQQYQQEKDYVGFTHTRYYETYKGVRVQYGVYYVHSKEIGRAHV